MKLIDKNGYVFKLKSSKDLGRAGLLNSIRYFQPMQQVKFELIKEQQLTLDELKKFVLAHIKRKPKHRLSLGTLEMIEDWVNEKKTIPELIKMFR